MSTKNMSAMVFALLCLAGAEIRAQDSAKVLQAEVERRFQRLQGMMAKLLGAVEQAKETGRVSSALERSRQLRITDRLKAIQEGLSKKKFSDALDEEKTIEKDLSRILRILRAEDEAEDAKERAEKLREMKEQLERLENLLADEEKSLEDTKDLDLEGRSSDDPEGQDKAGGLSKKQREIQRKAESLRREMEREAEAQEKESGEKAGEGEEGQDSQNSQNQNGEEGSEGKEGKQGKQGNQSSQGKQGKQSKSGKQGQQGQEGQEGQEGQQAQNGDQAQEKDQQGQEGQQGQRQGRQARQGARTASKALRKASERMENASRRLDAQNLKGAMEDQEEALESLRSAREEMQEDALDQEEENQEEVARKVASILHAMLAEQEIVTADTKETDAVKKGQAAAAAESETADPKSLGRRERALATDAEDAIRVLDADKTSVIAPSILERVKEDLENASGLLDSGETGEVTQLVQEDVITSLKELLEAIQPGDGDGDPNKKSPKEGEERPQMSMKMMRMLEKDLVSPSMEVKMLLSAQRRVRQRTERLASLGLIKKEGDAKAAESPAEKPGEQPADGAAPDPLHDQARRAAQAEDAVAGLARALVEKYPWIDALLLGMENPLDDLQDRAGPREGRGDKPSGPEGGEGATKKPEGGNR